MLRRDWKVVLWVTVLSNLNNIQSLQGSTITKISRDAEFRLSLRWSKNVNNSWCREIAPEERGSSLPMTSGGLLM